MNDGGARTIITKTISKHGAGYRPYVPGAAWRRVGTNCLKESEAEIEPQTG